MTNYLLDIGIRAARGANRLRKSRTPTIDPGYVSNLLKDAGANATYVSIDPVVDLAAGYKNFYYAITATTNAGTVRYFGSMPDKLFEPVGRLVTTIAGFEYKGPIERKRKDFEDLSLLNKHGIPAARPVAFDPKTGLVIEHYENGTNLGSFLDSRDYHESTKLEKFGQGLIVLKQTQDLGMHCGEAFTENFFVRDDNHVIITDMEGKSRLENPRAHELAIFLYSGARSMRPQPLVRLARELYGPEMLIEVPRYKMRLFWAIDPITLHKTNEAIKEVLK